MGLEKSPRRPESRITSETTPSQFEVISVPAVGWNQNKKFVAWKTGFDAETRNSRWYDLKAKCDNCGEKYKVFLQKGLRLDAAIRNNRVDCSSCGCIVRKEIRI